MFDAFATACVVFGILLLAWHAKRELNRYWTSMQEDDTDDTDDPEDGPPRGGLCLA